VFQALDSFDAGYRMAVSRPGIVFLNADLPGTGGFELAEKIKNEPRLGNPLVVAFVGENAEEVGGKVSAGRVDVCFPRRLDLNELREFIADLEKRSRLAVTA
jgi:CheY-like chemotaxis protein